MSEKNKFYKCLDSLILGGTMEQKRTIPQNVLQGIMSMFMCNNFYEEFACYYVNYDVLKECSFFIYSDDEGQELPPIFKTNFENDFAVIEIGFSDRYYAIDSNICEDMFRNGVANYKLDVCIELDTQAVSYLKKMFKSRNEVDIPLDKQELFYYLNEPGINYSSLPYMVENAKKITKSNFEQIYLNLKSYEMFKNFDFKLYVDADIISYKKDEAYMQVMTDQMFSGMQSETFKNSMRDFYDIQKMIYCLLMKAVLIEWNNSKKSTINKMKILIDYINNSLGVFCEREMAICYFYFQHNEGTKKFFKKVNKGSKEIENTINGMAWDLTHIRLIEKLYSFTIGSDIKFGIHPILTYDNGLKDILKLYPIKKMAIYDGFTIPCFKLKFVDLVPDSKVLLFDEVVTEKRKKVFERANINGLMNELNEEMNLINVAQ